MIRELLGFLRDITLGAVALLAAFLPARHWSALDDYLPVTRAFPVSAGLSLLVAVAAGLRAYLIYATLQASNAVDMTLQASGWRPASGGAVPSAAAATAQWVSSWTSLFTFALFTPVGLGLTYLSLSSLVRGLSWVSGEPMGDPVLTVIDRGIRRLRAAGDARHQRQQRERLEGVADPDVVAPGATLGFPGADLVVVSSRRKAEWEAGVTVITAAGWFVLGAPLERTTARGLRTFYPLTAVHGEVVLRRRVAYDLPVHAGDVAAPAAPPGTRDIRTPGPGR